MHLIDKGVIEEYEFHVPYAEDPSGVITYYTQSVAKAGGRRPALRGVRDARADGPRLPARARLRAARSSSRTRSSCAAWPRTTRRQLVVGAFREAIRDLSITEREPTIEESALRVSDTPPFPWSRETVDGERTVFNLTPVDNKLEARFAQFLDRATDVAAWAKLTMNSRFALEYISSTPARCATTTPTSSLRLDDDTCLVVETKGQEDLDVALKDRRARRWCQDAHALSPAATGPTRRCRRSSSTRSTATPSKACDGSLTRAELQAS